MPAERGMAYVKPGYYQVSLSPGQQTHAASGVSVASSHRAGRANATSSFSPPPNSARVTVAQHAGAAPGYHTLAPSLPQHSAAPRVAWQQTRQSSPSPVGTPRRPTPPRPVQALMMVDGETDAAHYMGPSSLSPRPDPAAITAAQSPQWPSAPSVEQVIASWPASTALQQPTRVLAHPAPEDVPPWRSPSDQPSVGNAAQDSIEDSVAEPESSQVEDDDSAAAPSAFLDGHKCASEESIASSALIRQPQGRKGNKGLGARGLPERMWSQPAPGALVHSPASPVDAASAPQSPQHSPSSPSFSSRNHAGTRRGLSGAERKRAVGSRNAAASSQPLPVIVSPRGREVDDVHCRGAENLKSQTPYDVRERAPSADARHRDNPCAKSETVTCESSRSALHGTRGDRLRTSDSSSGNSMRRKLPGPRKERAEHGKGKAVAAAESAPMEATTAVGDIEENSRMGQHEQELAALRAKLESERLERQRLEAMSEEAAGNLAKGETYLGTLSWELQEVCNQKENIMRQLKEKTEKHDDLLEKVRCEQERRKGLEDDLAKAAMIRRDLESRVRKDQGEKVSADLLVKDLQIKLHQFEKDWAAAMPLRRRAAEELPAGLEVQLEQLRKQLEDTVKVVHHRYSSVTADVTEAPEKPSVYRGHSGGSIGAVTSELSHTHLSLLDTTSPCSSRSLEPVAAMPSSSAEEFLPLGQEIEEELPTDERLIGEWGSPSQEETWEQLRPGSDGDPACEDLSAGLHGAGLPRTSSGASLSGASSGSGAPQPARSPSATPPPLLAKDGSMAEEASSLVLPSPARRAMSCPCATFPKSRR